MKKLTVLALLAVLVSLGLSACGTSATTPSTSGTTTVVTTTEAATIISNATDGESILKSSCTKCHDLDKIKDAKKTRDEWQTTIKDMIEAGAKVSDEQKPILLDYLAKNYKP
ncbi:MAG: hypothetical protein FIA99_14930 [Ruminiclostridium sp.]|nr:hypothetical protein [Ruminiclostridium sp.]